MEHFVTLAEIVDSLVRHTSILELLWTCLPPLTLAALLYATANLICAITDFTRIVVSFIRVVAKLIRAIAPRRPCP